MWENWETTRNKLDIMGEAQQNAKSTGQYFQARRIMSFVGEI
jgi:hypothetical protein